MNIMGLYDSAYWLSWLAWEVIMTLLVSLFTMIAGLCFRFSFFTRNNFIVVSLAFYLNLLSMVSSFVFCPTFSKQILCINSNFPPFFKHVDTFVIGLLHNNGILNL